MDLLVLFMSAFAASTILPMSSEVVLGALAASGSSEPSLLLAVARSETGLARWQTGPSAANAATWRTRFVSLAEARFERACRWFNRWGLWCLLLSWVPVVGDPLNLVAGVLRTPFISFVLLVLAGKAARYLLVLLVAV